MKYIFQTADMSFIKRILAIDNNYELLAYDNSPCLANYVPTGLWFILVDGTSIAGYVNLMCLNNVLWSPHIYIFKRHRGRGSEQWGRLIFNEMKQKYNAKKYLALTPYLPAKKYAEKIGFKYVTTLTQSIQKNGQLLDQYMLSLGDD